MLTVSCRLVLLTYQILQIRYMKKTCRLCKKPFTGRSDKIFCAVKCKSLYAYKLKQVTDVATKDIDKILHRNRSILLELMGKKKTQYKIPKIHLDRKKFNYSYVTRYHVNNRGKMINYIYDFSWMIFSDQEILISRLRRS